MVSAKEIQATCNDIIREFAPQQVILFGSYAYGTPTEASDVDLLVVLSGVNADRRQQAREMKKRLPARFRLDLHVRSPEEFAYRVSHNDWFLREILEKGQVLYDTEFLKCRKRQRRQAFTPLAGRMPRFRVTQRDVIAPTTFAERHANDRKLELAEAALVPIWQETGAMNPLTLEWVELAELDYAAIQLFLPQLATRGFENKICFNAQQCIEKYLKAWLQEANLPTPRTHDLNELLDLIVQTRPEWDMWRTDFSAFDTYAVDARYPGFFPTDADAEHAVRICENVRQTVRAILKLSEDGSTDDVSSAE